MMAISPRLLMAVLVALAIALGFAISGPIPSGIRIIDGDTMRVGADTFRLVGFDAPESNAKCERERELASRATARLSELIASGGVDLQQVPCACRPGTEGTRACNFGRLCA